MGRGIATTLCSQYRQAVLESPNNQVSPPDSYFPLQPVSQSVGQPTATNAEDHVTSSTFQNPAALPASLQLPANSEFNAPASNWRQAFVSSCTVGVTLVAIATGYACTSILRGALKVGQSVYSNRMSIRQTCTTCTQAVQSTYNAAKRRMVSVQVPRLPVGMRRRYAPQQNQQIRSRKHRPLQQPRVPALPPALPTTQSLQPTNTVVSTLAPGGMPGVEYSGLSDIGKSPDTLDAADLDAFVLPWSSDTLASGAPFMTGGLFHEPTLPPGPLHEDPAAENLIVTLAPEEVELIEQRWISYDESVSGFSNDSAEEKCLVEDKEANRVATAKPFRDEGQMELDEDWWSLPAQSSEPQSPNKASTNLADPDQVGPMSASPVFETVSHHH